MQEQGTGYVSNISGMWRWRHTAVGLRPPRPSTLHKSPHFLFLDHTHTHTHRWDSSVQRISSSHKPLPTHHTKKINRRTSMPSPGFEHATPVIEHLRWRGPQDGRSPLSMTNLSFRHHASYIEVRRTATPHSTLFIYSYLVNNYI